MVVDGWIIKGSVGYETGLMFLFRSAAAFAVAAGKAIFQQVIWIYMQWQQMGKMFCGISMWVVVVHWDIRVTVSKYGGENKE